VYEDGERYHPGEITTSIWSCAGCDEETFEYKYRAVDEDEFDPQYFPPRLEHLAQGDEVRPKVFQHLNPDLKRLYVEVVACLNTNCLVLCTMGLRALIEEICRDKQITGNNLYAKIEGLITFLPSRNLIDALHAFRWAGNYAAHENDPLSREEARLATEVIEDLLNFLYDLDYKASQMKYGTRMAQWKIEKLGPV